MQTIEITSPDDWHLHVRDGELLRAVLPLTARCFRRAAIMPNLHPPVTSVDQALAYRERLSAALPSGARFEPLMTLYLSDSFDVAEVALASRAREILGIKLYPKGIATAGQPGVSAIERCFSVLEAMQAHDLPLMVHGEVTSQAVDIFDREKVFLEETMAPLVRRFPKLRIVLEHISTRDAVDFVKASGPRVAATITAHHLLMNRNALFEGGIRPHHYCIPVLKREPHRRAVLDAATSGDPSFFLGTDSAPHTKHTKETACGCAGVFTAHAALELYAEAFEEAGRLERLEAFASHAGADFYGLPRNEGTVTLSRDPWLAPAAIPIGAEETVIPLRAGQSIRWRVSEVRSAH